MAEKRSTSQQQKLPPPEEYCPGGDPLDNIARGLFAVAKELSGIKTQIKYLGNGETGSRQGAIEVLGDKLRDSATAIASALERRGR